MTLLLSRIRVKDEKNGNLRPSLNFESNKKTSITAVSKSFQILLQKVYPLFVLSIHIHCTLSNIEEKEYFFSCLNKLKTCIFQG